MSRLIAPASYFLVFIVFAAPLSSFGQTLPHAAVVAGEMIKTSAAESRNALMATLYERLFDLRDRKNRKQIQIDASRLVYRVHMDRLKVLSPDSMSEEDILQAALKETGYNVPALGAEQEALVSAYRDLTGVNGSLRAMRDIINEIIFVEQRIARHTPK